MPDRIENLRPTLDCLLRQSRPPDEIVLAIPSFSIRQQRGYEIPSFLSEIPQLRIMRCDRDWGPATKWIPVLKEESAAGRKDSLVIVVDDDRLYPVDTIETYLHYHDLLPDAAICFRGARMPRSFDWRKASMTHGHGLRAPARVDVITGCGSYLVQPRFFREAVFDYSTAPRSAFYMDDIWISGWLARGGVARYVVPCSTKLHSVNEQAKTMNLHEVPGGRQPSNKEVIAFFKDDWNA